jgi:predicted DNA binding CopG/RHH family protein
MMFPFPLQGAGPGSHRLHDGSEPAEQAPKSKTEAQERAFWEDEGRDSTRYLDGAKAQRAVLPNLKPSTKTISLRLPQHLLDAIKAVANARDVPYPSLIKVWLQEKVEG